jgi:hypothetical protein
MNEFTIPASSSVPTKGLHHLHHQDHHDIEQSLQSPRKRSRSSSQEFLLNDKNESLSSHSLEHSQIAIDKRWWKFVYLVGGIMFFFGLHNYMQELIMRQPGFKVSNYLFSLWCVFILDTVFCCLRFS